MTDEKKLLLLSTSKCHDGEYLSHAEDWVKNHFADASGHSILFIPYALQDHDGYTERVTRAFDRMGLSIVSAHQVDDFTAALDQSAGIFVGGGNSFRLLKHLMTDHVLNVVKGKLSQAQTLLDTLKAAVDSGKPYMGASAGSNIACPTIMTTNDMPIVEVATLHALGLFQCQINPHYIDPDPKSLHQGESRELRIKQYHEENDTPVIGLREGSALRVNGHKVELLGEEAPLFRKGEARHSLQPGPISPSQLRP